MAVWTRTDVRRGDVTLSCLCAGPGPDTVVLLHGLAGSAAEMVPGAEALLGGTERTLSARHNVPGVPLERSSGTPRTIAIDQRGHGHSTRRPADLSRAAYVDDVVAVVGALAGGGPVMLVGQSMGAHTAMLVAAEHPGLVHRLVLAEGGVGGPGDGGSGGPGGGDGGAGGDDEPGGGGEGPGGGGEGPGGGDEGPGGGDKPGGGDDGAGDGEGDYPARLGAWFASWPVPFADRAAAEAWLGGTPIARAFAADLEERDGGWWPRFDADVMETAIRGVAETARWDAWRRVSAPTLLVAGERSMLDPAEVARMRSMRPETAYTVIPGAGHDVHLDRPDAWAGVLRAFLLSGG